MLSIFNQAPAPPYIPRTNIFVLAKEKKADEWRLVPQLRAKESSYALGPEMPTCTVEYQFGSTKENYQSALTIKQAVDLRGWYVMVMIQKAGFAPQPHWIGVVVDEDTVLDRSTISGKQTFQAFGVGHLLDLAPITKGFVYHEDSDGNPEAKEIPFLPKFNERHPRGHRVLGNRSENVGPDDAYLFAPKGKGDVWNNFDILDYLLRYYLPDTIEVELAGQYEDLAAIEGIYDLAGKTLWECLNILIERRRGFCFALRPGVEPDDPVQLEVRTITEVELSLGDKTIPANDQPVHFVLPETGHWKHIYDPLSFRFTTLNRYDKITVQGERVLAMASFGYSDDNLQPSWSSGLETAYKLAKAGDDSDANDLARSADAYSAVYLKHRVPTDFTGKVGSACAQSDVDATLAIVANADGTFDETGEDGFFWTANKHFESHLPLLVGVRYDQADAPDQNADDTEAEHRPLLAWFGDSVGSQHEPTGNFLVADRMHETNLDLQSCGICVSHNELGVMLHHSPRHYFAGGGHFAGAKASNTEPELDYERLGFTAALRLDVRQQIVVEDLGSDFEAPSELVVTIPWAEYWWIAPHTTVDIVDGQPVAIHDDNRVQRNDLEKLYAFAMILKAWYGVERHALVIPLKDLGTYVPVGSMLLGVTNVYSYQPIRTVVSRIVHDYVNGFTTLETGWHSADVTFDPEIVEFVTPTW